MAFVTNGKEESAGNKNDHKRKLHASNVEKGHYSNECDEEQTGEDKTVKHQTKKEQTSS